MYTVYMIFLTGFALFGLYCFVDTLLSIIDYSKQPPTVTIFLNTQDYRTFKKIKYVENCVPNNYNILYPFENAETEQEQLIILNKYLKNVLNVNKK